MALAFASKDYRVVLTGIEKIDETTSEILTQGGEALGISLDVTAPPQVERTVKEILQKWGQIDVLVNNAGIEGPTAPLVEVSPSDWEHTLKVNLTGAFLCDRAVAPHLMSRRSGSIIHISSVGGMQAYPLRSPYSVSKRALIALTETLAVELGPYGVRVNAVCPGPVEGLRMDRVIRYRAQFEQRARSEVKQEYEKGAALGHLVTPADIVNLVLFLASDQSPNITGQAIRACGGYKL